VSFAVIPCYCAGTAKVFFLGGGKVPPKKHAGRKVQVAAATELDQATELDKRLSSVLEVNKLKYGRSF